MERVAARHLIDLLGLDREWVLALFERGRPPARAARHAARRPAPLAGRTAALVFHKPSLRTRVSFTVGMHELGGDAVDLGAVEVSENGRESLKDVAHVLSRHVRPDRDPHVRAPHRAHARRARDASR